MKPEIPVKWHSKASVTLFKDSSWSCVKGAAAICSMLDVILCAANGHNPTWNHIATCVFATIPHQQGENGNCSLLYNTLCVAVTRQTWGKKTNQEFRKETFDYRIPDSSPQVTLHMQVRYLDFWGAPIAKTDSMLHDYSVIFGGMRSFRGFEVFLLRKCPVFGQGWTRLSWEG